MAKENGAKFWIRFCAPSVAMLAIVAGTLHVTGVWAAAEEENPIKNYYEIKPDNRCAEGEGAPARAAGTLFRGARLDEAGLEYLASHGVKTVLNFETSAANDEVALVKQLGLSINEIHHPMSSGMGVNKLPNGDYDHDSIIAAVADMRRSENFPEYVHCKYGDDRTGMIVALHRVFNECWAPKDAEREWNKIEGVIHHVFNIPKHHYFHVVTRHADLREYYKKRLNELVPVRAAQPVPGPLSSLEPSEPLPAANPSALPSEQPVPMQEPGGIVGPH